jgi:hypothetical protein
LWTYRRIQGNGVYPAVADISLQNWEKGNDFIFKYLFVPRSELGDSEENFMGGIDLDVLDAAEKLAYGWHYWFKVFAIDTILVYLTVVTEQKFRWRSSENGKKKCFGNLHWALKIPLYKRYEKEYRCWELDYECTIFFRCHQFILTGSR